MNGYDAYRISSGLHAIASALERIATVMESKKEHKVFVDIDKAKEVIRDAIIEAK